MWYTVDHILYMFLTDVRLCDGIRTVLQPGLKIRKGEVRKCTKVPLQA